MNAVHKLGLLVCVLSCCFTGCGGPASGRLKTATVTGRVTFKGEPLSLGEIKFLPDGATGEGVRVAYSTLDENGRYSLTTYGNGDGAILGSHRVTIVSREEVTPGMGKRMTPQGMAPAQQPKSFIPERYAKPETSGLTAEVKSGSNEINFDLQE